LTRPPQQFTPNSQPTDSLWGGCMAIPKNEKHRLYAHYAAHCLDMATAAEDYDARTIQREMAAEWLCLADAVPHSSKPLKRHQMQMQ
jgi:hypothetical protein